DALHVAERQHVQLPDEDRPDGASSAGRRARGLHQEVQGQARRAIRHRPEGVCRSSGRAPGEDDGAEEVLRHQLRVRQLVEGEAHHPQAVAWGLARPHGPEPNRPPGVSSVCMPSFRQEALWVLRAQYGDRDALEQLLEAVQPSLRRYLCGLVGDLDADDVLQEVLVLVYRRLGDLENPEVFRAWALRIASRAGYRYLEKRKRWPHQPDDEAPLENVPAPNDRPSDALLWDALRSDAISPASRGVLVLHFQEGLSLPDVAAILDVPLGTVKSRLAYGLAALRARLGAGRRE